MPGINYMSISRFAVFLSVFLLLIYHFWYHNILIYYAAIALVVFYIISMILFIIQFKRGNIDIPTKIIIETNVEKAFSDGVISEEQADNIPKTIIVDAKEIFLNLVFNLAIVNHFDLVPVEVLRESLPDIPPAQLMKLYNESRDISDDLNDYFRSQKFLNKADVIKRSEDIKEYLKKTYPWMDDVTLSNTYDYFFLGIGNG